MAGFFGLFNYAKEGPGVEKGVSDKKAFFNFFDIYSRKFWILCKLSLLFSICFIPSIIIVIFLSSISGGNGFVDTVIVFIPFIFAGPFISGMTKVVRDFVNEEPVFMFSEFKKAAIENAKYSLFTSSISTLAAIFVSFAIRFYLSQISTSFIYIIPLAITLICAVFIFFSQYYAYLLIVTVNLTYKQILKNCFIFSVLSFWRNILTTIIIIFFMLLFAFICLITYVMMPIMGILAAFMLLMFLPGFFSFLINFIAFPQLQKYVIAPYYDSHPDETAQGLLKQIYEKDDGNEHTLNKKPSSEYVYENGRMVHRSLIEKDSLFDDTNSVKK